ncbi:MAG: choice-of-anchor L domain-containing protein, partial [Bacteroidales bacterium]|nr:choice-of-anchor L domain-containing protein [Bacteroidales bacterium]
MKPIPYYAMLMLLLLALQPRLSGQSGTRTQANSSRSRGSLMVSNVIDSILLGNSIAGPGVQLIGCRYLADDSAIGFFRDESFSLGIDSGIVISTGSIFDIPGPNISSSTGTALGMPGDTDLTTLQPNYATLDAAFIELSFIPLSDT